MNDASHKFEARMAAFGARLIVAISLRCIEKGHRNNSSAMAFLFTGFFCLPRCYSDYRSRHFKRRFDVLEHQIGELHVALNVAVAIRFIEA